MNDFEKEYYEAESFWEGDMLQDEANTERIQKTAALIPGDVKTLVDVGCGNGVFVNYLKDYKPNIDILAVDRSKTALKYVKTKKTEGDLANLQFADRSFDCVTCLEVIEHLPVSVYESALQNLARIADKYLIVSVPYKENLEERYNKCPGCKTIFNYDLHLRSFSDNYFEHLFDDYGFKCVSTQKLGASEHFRGHYFFRKIFYKEQFNVWQSPICPMCGYHEQSDKTHIGTNSTVPVSQPSRQRKLIRYFTGLPKLFWPKEIRHYWILGLYKRDS